MNKKEWVGLTDDERFRLWVKSPAETEAHYAFALAVEAKLKEKNHDPHPTTQDNQMEDEETSPNAHQ